MSSHDSGAPDLGSAGPPAPAPRPRVLRRADRWTAVCAVLLHTLAVLWIWRTWGLGLRGGWLVWIDLPVSLLYLSARNGALLAFSLVLGGLQWAVVGALLSKLIAALTRSR